MRYIPALLVALIILTACGSKPESQPKETAMPTCTNSCLNPDGTFANPPGSPQRTATWWDFQKFFWGGLLGRQSSPTVPPGHVIPVAQAEAAWQSISGDKIQWLGHSAFRYSISDTTILTDPLLTNRASPFQWAGPKRFVASPLRPQDAAADLILITHNHYDHLDLETLKNLPNKQTVQVVVPLGVAPLIHEAGIPNVTELDWHKSIQFKGLQITLVPAIHFSARWTDDRNRTLWGGYVIKSDKLNLYLTGDTTMHPSVFQEIGDKYGPFTHGLVSIGAYEPRSIMVGSHTTPEEAVQIGKDTKSRTLIAHHWGALVLTTEPAFEPPARFTAAAKVAGVPEADTWLMKIGETRPLKP